MKKLFFLLAASVLWATSLQPVPAGAKTSVPDLAGITTISGDHSASVVVSLPRDVKLDLDSKWRREDGPNPSVSIEGAGRFVGVVIAAEPHTPDRPQTVTMGRFAQCAQAGCTSDRKMNAITAPYVDKDTLVAGLYRIYLIADGAPAEVTLRFPDLPGAIALEPTDEAKVDLKTPQDAILSNGETLWSAAEVFDAGKVGFSTTAIWVKTRRLQNFSSGLCQLSSLKSPPPEAYGPHCTALDQTLGSGYSMLNATYPDRGFEMIAHFGYHDQGYWIPNLDNDRVGLGLWVHSPVEKIQRIGATSVFVQTAETWHVGP